MNRASIKRRAAIAVATGGILMALTQAALPDRDRLTPAGRQRELVEQAAEARRRELEDVLRRADLHGESERAGNAIPGEHRPPAGDAARRLMRRR